MNLKNVLIYPTLVQVPLQPFIDHHFQKRGEHIFLENGNQGEGDGEGEAFDIPSSP